MSVVLAESQGLFHRWEYTPPGGGTSYTIDYHGDYANARSVAVDGEMVAVDSARGRAERYLFYLGAYQALLDVRMDLLLKIKYLKLIVDGTTVYTEGEAQAYTSPEELQALRAGPRIPPQVRVNQTVEAVEMRYRESIFQGMLLLFLAILFTGMSGYLLSLAGSSVKLITLLLLLLGVWVMYLGLAKLVNRTTIRLDRQELRMKRGPLPTRFKKAAGQPASQIEGFTIEKHVRRSQNSRSTFYALIARLANGDRHGVLEDASLEVIVAIRNALATFQDDQGPAVQPAGPAEALQASAEA